MYGFRQDGLRLGDFAPSSIPHRDIQLPLGASECQVSQVLGLSEFLLEGGTDFGFALSGFDEVHSICKLLLIFHLGDGHDEGAERESSAKELLHFGALGDLGGVLVGVEGDGGDCGGDGECPEHFLLGFIFYN